MAETIDALITELNSQIVSERGLKLATEPKVTISRGGDGQAHRRTGRPRLYARARRYCLRSNSRISRESELERLVAAVTDSQIDEALGKIAEQNRPFAPKPEGAKAEKGDRVVIDFTGRIEGEAFEGGTGGDVGVNIGVGYFHSRGSRINSSASGRVSKRLVKITFPTDYAKAQLAGKEAEFEVTVKSIEAPGVG